MKKSIIQEEIKNYNTIPMETNGIAPESISGLSSSRKTYTQVARTYGKMFLEKSEVVLAHTQKIWSFLGLVLIAGSLWYGLSVFGFFPGGDLPVVSSGKWQAVFLTNGQVYFGHLSNYNHQYAELRNIYYIQSPQNQGQANMSLVKLGLEVHGPEDLVYIPKDKILFLENLRDDSQVVKTIESAK